MLLGTAVFALTCLSACNDDEPQKKTDSENSGNNKPSTNVSKGEFSVNGVKFKMISLSSTVYRMGSNDGDSDEKPLHAETVAAFSIGQTEVTQKLWQAVMGSNPSFFAAFNNPNLPVENVSWSDCQIFISKLNELTGQKFRLPTEAEWEYAACADRLDKYFKYSGGNSLDDLGWYSENCTDSPHPVAKKKPNGLGIYDMSGNVSEWCSDGYSRNYSSPRNSSNRVIRGGSFIDNASDCRVTNRSSYSSDYRGRNVGLRLAL